MGDGRAVSNTLGFVLLFGVVFGSIVIINTVGLGALQEGRDTTISQNAALSMESLSDAVEDLRQENSTARLSVIRGGGGSLNSGSDTTIRVTTVDAGGAPSSLVYERTFRPIVYRLDDTEIVYEAGAVIRTQENGGAYLIDGPRYKATDEAALLPVVSTYSENPQSVSGQTVTTYLEKNHSSLATHRPTHEGEVIYEIETTEQRAPVWERALEERISTNDACDVMGVGDRVECTSTYSGASSRTVIVRDIRVTYEFVT